MRQKKMEKREKADESSHDSTALVTIVFVPSLRDRQVRSFVSTISACLAAVCL